MLGFVGSGSYLRNLGKLGSLPSVKMHEERALIADSYPGWHETRKFTVQVRSTVVASKDRLLNSDESGA